MGGLTRGCAEDEGARRVRPQWAAARCAGAARREVDALRRHRRQRRRCRRRNRSNRQLEQIVDACRPIDREQVILCARQDEAEFTRWVGEGFVGDAVRDALQRKVCLTARRVEQDARWLIRQRPEHVLFDLAGGQRTAAHSAR